jgi:hypothetical protein
MAAPEETPPRAPKPNLLRGRAVDLLALTPDSFEDFAYLTLSEIGPLHGFRVIGGPSGSSDAGFDLTGERIADKKGVCVQCKRLAGTFHLSMVGVELAKVALKSALEGGDVKEHLFLVAGTVGNTLRSALREVGRGRLCEKAKEAAEHDADLQEPRRQASERSIDVKGVVDQYVAQLDVLRVWSGRDFDQELGRVWSRITPSLERFFAVEVILREHPRPDFDLLSYLAQFASKPVAESIALRASSSGLPPNVFRTRSEDPLAYEAGPAREQKPRDAIDELLDIHWGACRVLHGPGGAGKTTILTSIRDRLALQFSSDEDAPLPVLCRLSGYSGSLKNLIHQSLGIKSGEWQSLPNRFSLLLDGLDEVPSAAIQPLLDELEAILRDGRVGSVVSLRSGGLRHPASLTLFDGGLRLHPLTIRQAIQIAQSRIPAELRPKFLEQLRASLSDIGAALLFLPFGHAAASKMFMDSGSLPATAEALLEGIVRGRLDRNRHRGRTLEDRLRDIPENTVRALGEAAAFEGRIVMQRASFDLQEMQSIVTRSLGQVQNARAFGAATLSDIDAYELLRHYEFIEPIGDERVRLCHDLLADFLAAPTLAERWQEMVGRLSSNIGDDAWLYASRFIQSAAQSAFLTTVFTGHPVLASSCAKAIGRNATTSLEAAVAAIDAQGGRLAEYEAATCLGILATPTSLEKLRARVRDVSQRASNRAFQARRALSLHGDVETLRSILEEEEPGASGGFSVSSSGIDLWQRAPAGVTVALARERVDRNPAERRIVLSIRTIQTFGDDSDFDRILRVVDQTAHTPAFYAGGYCLHTLDAKRALAELTARMTELSDISQLPYLEILSNVGEEVDSKELLAWLLEAPSPKDESDADRRRRVVKVVCNSALPASFEARLRDEYEQGDRYERAEIWQIATAHGLAAFDELAFKAFDAADSGEVGLAANFAKAAAWDEGKHARFCELCLSKAGVAAGTEWFVPRILVYMLSRGKTEDVGSIVDAKLREMIPRFKVARQAWLERIRRSDRSTPRVRTAEDNEEVLLSASVPPLVRVAADVFALISPDVAREVVGLDLSNAGEEARVARRVIAGRLPPDVVDAAVAELADAEARIQVLADIASLGTTEKRIAILCQDAATVLNWPGDSLAKAVDRLWCREVAQGIARVVAETWWDPRIGSQMAQGLVSVVAQKVSKDIATEVVLPAIAEARTQESKEILQWWYDIGMRPRK